MKKIFPILLAIFLFVGCGNMKASPTSEVEDFLSKYQKLDSAVLSQLNTIVDVDANLTPTQKDEYKNVIKRQYKDLTYNVKDEVIDGNNATVTIEIEVYDYHKTLLTVQQHLAENPDEFSDTNNTFDENKYFDYRVSQMINTTDKIKYTLNLTLTKEEDKWVINNLSEIDREKIHGLYNYS